LELNIALVKQLTGGDTYMVRHLHENPVEFAPEFKIFISGLAVANTIINPL
jgi:putative DNA primase/helicase